MRYVNITKYQLGNQAYSTKYQTKQISRSTLHGTQSTLNDRLQLFTQTVIVDSDRATKRAKVHQPRLHSFMLCKNPGGYTATCEWAVAENGVSTRRLGPPILVIELVQT